MRENKLSERIDRLVAAWLRGLPASPGGYAEQLLPGWIEARPPESPRERTALTQLRLAYVFLRAGRRGIAGATAAGRAALDRANGVFWRDELRGWTRSADESGAPLDSTLDTYDQAFGLLALSWDGDGPGDDTGRYGLARRRALDALAALDGECAGAEGGYRDFETAVPPRGWRTIPA